MKITRRPASGLPDIGGPAATGDAPEAESAVRQPPSDRVQLSQGARLRAQLRSELRDVSEVSTEQVRALRDEVEAGTYYREPRAVAERFLAEVAGELLS